MQGLRLNEHGQLVDERGKALNDLGATRFDLAVQALRGVFPSAEGAASNERQDGAFMDALCKYPAEWLFQVVGIAAAGAERDVLAEHCASTVRACCGEGAVLAVTQAAKGPKYVSVRVRALVRSSAEMNTVIETLLKDSRVKMAFE